MVEFPDWDEWNGLTREQQAYSLYKTLQSMNEKLNHCPDQLRICGDRFDKLERRKRFDTSVAGTTGLFGGILAWLGSKIFS